MRINTLGPETTDSYCVAKNLCKNNDEILLYDSFDALIDNLWKMKDEYILIPAAYESVDKKYDWKDFNLDYWENVELTRVFHKKTKQMVLIEHTNFKKNIAVIQPATKIMLKKYLKEKRIDSEIEYESSKVKAYQQFFSNKYRFTIISSDVVRVTDQIITRKIYNPEMVWCLYKVRGGGN